MRIIKKKFIAIVGFGDNSYRIMVSNDAVSWGPIFWLLVHRYLSWPWHRSRVLVPIHGPDYVAGSWSRLLIPFDAFFWRARVLESVHVPDSWSKVTILGHVNGSYGPGSCLRLTFLGPSSGYATDSWSWLLIQAHATNTFCRFLVPGYADYSQSQLMLPFDNPQSWSQLTLVDMLSSVHGPGFSCLFIYPRLFLVPARWIKRISQGSVWEFVYQMDKTFSYIAHPPHARSPSRRRQLEPSASSGNDQSSSLKHLCLYITFIGESFTRDLGLSKLTPSSST